MKVILSLLMFLAAPFSYGEESLGFFPVQDQGRVKPFESFAREALQLLHGRQTFKIKRDGSTSKREATEVIFTMAFLPEIWSEQELIVIDNRGLKESLKVDPLRKYFKFSELVVNPRVGLLVRELSGKVDRKERLTAFYKAVQNLNNQITLFNAISRQFAFRVLPPEKGEESTTWRAVAQLPETYKKAFDNIFLTLAKNSPKEKGAGISAEGRKNIASAVESYIAKVKAEYGDYYPEGKIKAELWLHGFQPFQWSWILYLLSALALLVSWLGGKPIWYKAGWGLAIVSLVIHTAGFLVRSYIVERAPVTNMYETVVWAPWGTVLFAMILEAIKRNKIALLAANVVAVLCLILASMAPAVLDPSLQPLEPVLRSNFWLLTHVLLIVLSYSAFFLAWGVGNFVITVCLIDEKKYLKQVKDGSLVVYRANQIGVVLLFVGIILGGIWADASWGRFWGWDPKETWALIAFLGYVAVIHAKVSGWIKDFGMAATSVSAFSLVVMAWYGVNYVLGAGLHSYGFGAGGVEYVASVVGVQLLYVAFVAKVRQSKLNEEAQK